MHEIESILGWLAVAIDLVGAMIMAWAFVTSVVGLVRGSIIDATRSENRERRIYKYISKIFHW